MNRITCIVSDEMMENINKICKQNHFTRAEFNRRAIEDYINEVFSVRRRWGFDKPAIELTKEQETIILQLLNKNPLIELREIASKIFGDSLGQDPSTYTPQKRAIEKFLSK